MKSPEPQGPSAEELAAAARARREKIDTIQEQMQDETDRLFRLYGAKSAFGMK